MWRIFSSSFLWFPSLIWKLFHRFISSKYSPFCFSFYHFRVFFSICIKPTLRYFKQHFYQRCSQFFTLLSITWGLLLNLYKINSSLFQAKFLSVFFSIFLSNLSFKFLVISSTFRTVLLSNSPLFVPTLSNFRVSLFWNFSEFFVFRQQVFSPDTKNNQRFKINRRTENGNFCMGHLFQPKINQFSI